MSLVLAEQSWTFTTSEQVSQHCYHNVYLSGGSGGSGVTWWQVGQVSKWVNTVIIIYLYTCQVWWWTGGSGVTWWRAVRCDCKPVAEITSYCSSTDSVQLSVCLSVCLSVNEHCLNSWGLCQIDSCSRYSSAASHEFRLNVSSVDIVVLDLSAVYPGPLWKRGYHNATSTAVQAWQPCPLWEPSPSHPILL